MIKSLKSILAFDRLETSGAPVHKTRHFYSAGARLQRVLFFNNFLCVVAFIFFSLNDRFGIVPKYKLQKTKLILWVAGGAT